MTILKKQTIEYTEVIGAVHCPMCTHTVDAIILQHRKGGLVKPGQRCPRCHSTLDAGYVLEFPRAA